MKFLEFTLEEEFKFMKFRSARGDIGKELVY